MLPWGMPLMLEVAYGDAAALAYDAATQLARGGLFVAVDASALPPLAELTLRLVIGGARVDAAARLTVATTEAACVELAPEAREALLIAVAAHVGRVPARAGEKRARIHDATAQRADSDTQRQGADPPADDGAAPGHGANAQLLDLDGEPDDAAALSEPAATKSAASGRADEAADTRGQLTLDRKIAVMSVNEKIQLALHGNRDARALLIRDRAGIVQSSLIRNPKISSDEVHALARAPQLAPDCAETLAQHPSWGSSSSIALALVRNPRTPLPTATALVNKLSPGDLRVVAKGLGVRTQVAAAARKRLLDPGR
jgi:hypothetical protein